MLKIKDDVDIKELKKLGFEPRYSEETGEISYYIIPYRECFAIRKKRKIRFKVSKHNGTTWLFDNYAITNPDKLDILYDLIQAGLIEKV